MEIRESKILAGPGEMSGLDVTYDPVALTVKVSGGVLCGVVFQPETFQADSTDEDTKIDVRLLQNGEIHFEQQPIQNPKERAEDLPLLHNLAELRFHSGVGNKDDRDFIHIGRLV
ncbi:hypothetical protein [Melghirimyces algeriensis]|uniref:Uncharacterized protein n=1 Tax=Melghirimyces algeriensis TaxID=910412 RepID=A0A521C6X0_9BACL|nr:hypothetical protein [Melghirimyces algeriensis]SMO55176.1 hypothetical protein SAMN06264849_103160 [Melghirimyces algeriensis]